VMCQDLIFTHTVSIAAEVSNKNIIRFTLSEKIAR